jgi:c(7)-type cytochrome triheme protein
VTPSQFRSAILALGFLTGSLVFSSALAQVKTPADITLPRGKDSPGTVTFSHEKHIAAGNKCTSCHTKVFKMKKPEAGELTMAKMKAGEQCGACHNGKTEVAGKMPFTVDDKANCERCHKK